MDNPNPTPSYTPAPNIPGVEYDSPSTKEPSEASEAPVSMPAPSVLPVIERTPIVELSPTLKAANPHIEVPSTEPEWFLAEGIPGKGPKPPWFNEKTYGYVVKQAEAHPELRKKLSNFTGAPEEGYDVELEEELQNFEVNYEDPLLEGFAEYARDMNMSQEGFNNVVNWFIKRQQAALNDESDAQEKYRLEEIQKLGPNVEEDFKILGQWGKNNLPEELHETFTEMLFNSNSVKVFNTLLDKIVPTQLTHVAPGTGLTRQQIQQMMQTPEYKRMDPDVVRTVDAEAQNLYGTKTNPIYK